MTAVGWCPSTYRIYQAPDGGLARVKVPGGVLTVEQLRVVADAARRHGNGTVDLTSRANLQLRGVDPANAPRLRAQLAPVGLSAPTAEIEDRRNVLASPSAGLDEHELVDARSLVATIVASLDRLPASPAPPHKFGVLIDGGGVPTLRAIALDLGLGAILDQSDRLVFEVALGDTLADARRTSRLAVTAEEVPRLVAAAFRLCATPPDGGPARRMRDVVADCGWDAVVEVLAGDVELGPLQAARGAAATSPAWTSGAGEPGGSQRWVAVRAAGSPDAGSIEWLADAVQAAGGREVRLTPWRSVVVPTKGPGSLVEVLESAGWTSDAASLAPRPVGAHS